MVGLIQKVLIDLVESAAGHEAVREMKRCAEIPADKRFRLNEVYDDVEWRRLFKAACEVLKITQEQAEVAYAEAFCKDALKRWPTWFEMSKNSREFLLRQPKIHNYFATGVQDPQARKAINDKFRLEEVDNKEIIMHYCSPNQLCGLYVALAHCIINHYQDQATIKQCRCVKEGDPECEIHIRWDKIGDCA